MSDAHSYAINTIVSQPYDPIEQIIDNVRKELGDSRSNKILETYDDDCKILTLSGRLEIVVCGAMMEMDYPVLDIIYSIGGKRIDSALRHIYPCVAATLDDPDILEWRMSHGGVELSESLVRVVLEKDARNCINWIANRGTFLFTNEHIVYAAKCGSIECLYCMYDMHVKCTTIVPDTKSEEVCDFFADYGKSWADGDFSVPSPAIAMIK